MSELPMLENALLEAAHRRYGRRRAGPLIRRLALGAALLALAGATVTLSRPDRTDERVAQPPAELWTTSVDAEGGFELGLPPGWQRASESLTPHLSDPRELLAVGTFALHYRRGRCNHQPDGALADMAPTDAFVTVQERGRGASAGYPARPNRFQTYAEAQRGDFAGCIEGRPDLIEFWLPFSDAQRHFYALVVVGRDAPAHIRAEAFSILDRLRFDPTFKPDWDSAG